MRKCLTLTARLPVFIERFDNSWPYLEDAIILLYTGLQLLVKQIWNIPGISSCTPATQEPRMRYSVENIVYILKSVMHVQLLATNREHEIKKLNLLWGYNIFCEIPGEQHPSQLKHWQTFSIPCMRYIATTKNFENRRRLFCRRAKDMIQARSWSQTCLRRNGREERNRRNAKKKQSMKSTWATLNGLPLSSWNPVLEISQVRAGKGVHMMYRLFRPDDKIKFWGFQDSEKVPHHQSLQQIPTGI